MSLFKWKKDKPDKLAARIDAVEQGLITLARVIEQLAQKQDHSAEQGWRDLLQQQSDVYERAMTLMQRAALTIIAGEAASGGRDNLAQALGQMPAVEQAIKREQAAAQPDYDDDGERYLDELNPTEPMLGECPTALPHRPDDSIRTAVSSHPDATAEPLAREGRPLYNGSTGVDDAGDPANLP